MDLFLLDSRRGVEEVGPMSLYMEFFVDGIPKQSVPTIDKNVQ